MVQGYIIVERASLKFCRRRSLYQQVKKQEWIRPPSLFTCCLSPVFSFPFFGWRVCFFIDKKIKINFENLGWKDTLWSVSGWRHTPFRMTRKVELILCPQNVNREIMKYHCSKTESTRKRDPDNARPNSVWLCLVTNWRLLETRPCFNCCLFIAFFTVGLWTNFTPSGRFKHLHSI